MEKKQKSVIRSKIIRKLDLLLEQLGQQIELLRFHKKLMILDLETLLLMILLKFIPNPQRD